MNTLRKHLRQNQLHNLEDILGTIYGLASLLEESDSHIGSDDETQVLGVFHRGCTAAAIKHLADGAISLTEVIEKQDVYKSGGSDD